MRYRHEVKHVISALDKAVLMARLSAVAKKDAHAGGSGQYRVRSLYFDNLYDRALMDKLSGTSYREKFRLRYYNEDNACIRLEKKVKEGGMGYKLSAPVTKEEAQKIVDGDTMWMATSPHALVRELYVRMKTEGLRPRTIVDYTRTPFVYAPGNVRVTIDENIRTSLRCIDFLNPACVTIPAGNDLVLEVKWDAYLPACIRRAVQLGHAQATAFSKYAVSRRLD